jgi:ATP-dependent RNA helicase DeaD
MISHFSGMKQSLKRFFCTLQFNRYAFTDNLKQYLKKQQISVPTSIQAKTIPLLLQNNYPTYYIAAQTGTGKTMAYLLPVL